MQHQLARKGEASKRTALASPCTFARNPASWRLLNVGPRHPAPARAERAVRGWQAYSADLLLTAHLRANLRISRPLAPTPAAGRHMAPSRAERVRERWTSVQRPPLHGPPTFACYSYIPAPWRLLYAGPRHVAPSAQDRGSRTDGRTGRIARTLGKSGSTRT